MDAAEHVAALERDSAALVAAAAAALDLRVPVAACPGWTAADLLWHVAVAHDAWRSAVEHRGGAPAADREPRVEPPAGDLAAVVAAGASQLVEVLQAVSPPTAVTGATEAGTVSSVARRAALDTAIHAWDLAAAVRAPHGVDARLASDGIDELLFGFAERAPGAAPVGGSVHVHCTDVPGEWLVRWEAAASVVTREHAKGDCALRGPAQQLLLVMWRRLPLEAIDVVGDAGVAARFVARPSLS